MAYMLKSVMSSKNGLKVMALIMGATVWWWLQVDSVITVEKKVPICFFEVSDQQQIEGVDSIALELKGARSLLTLLDDKDFSVHVDGRSLREGMNELYVHDQKIFLPEGVKLVNCSPQIITVSNQQKV